MKRLLTIILICTVVLSLTGCVIEETTISINVENKEDLSNTVFGRDALVEIGDILWYDSTTRIVYWWNGHFNMQNATTPSPYYAPNGLPYRYNPETNIFEEIEE